MTMTALFAGLVAVIGAVAGGMVKIFGALSAMRVAVAAAEQAAREAAEKNAEKVEQVHILVNDQHDKLREEIKALKEKNVQALAETAALRTIIGTLNITAARAEGVTEGQRTAQPAKAIDVVVTNPSHNPVQTTEVT